MARLAIVLAFSSLSILAHGQIDEPYRGPYGRLDPFVTDGCTGIVDGTREEPELWRHCCVAHDLKYWAGGTQDEKLGADQTLRTCVAATGHAEFADVMYLGVRAGGSPYLPTPWRWGFGWTSLRGYSALTEEELKEVERLTPSPLTDLAGF